MNWIDENYFYNQFKHIWFKSAFKTLKIMDFQNVPLTKVVHVYMTKGMNEWMHDVHDIKSICSQNIFIIEMQC
jgi:hypothetical protein